MTTEHDDRQLVLLHSIDNRLARVEQKLDDTKDSHQRQLDSQQQQISDLKRRNGSGSTNSPWTGKVILGLLTLAGTLGAIITQLLASLLHPRP